MKMVRYAKNELFSITDFKNQISSALNKIKKDSLEKIGIIKNNRVEAVVISTDEYDRLKELEENIELAEHKKIYKMVKEREKTPLSDYFSMEEMSKKFNIDLKKL
jgi:PHD/YefM family antitoxin component YafN of YafNO toxin-antitoxin module